MTKLIPVLLALLAALYTGCLDDGGTEIPNELTGREYLAGSGAAAGAVVKLVPVGHVPGDSARSDSAGRAIFTATTGPDGRFAFRDVPPGQYNILASQGGSYSFRDSVALTGRGQDLPADTLKAPGSLAGRVVLQPQHDPRTAVVQVLGTQVYVNVENEDGRFILPKLGAGEYRLRVTTSEAGYTPLFREVRVRVGVLDTLDRPLEPFYSATPVVTGIRAVPAGKGVVALSWDRPAFGKVDAYLVYRDSLDALLPSEAPYRNVKDTVFLDTVYSKDPRPGQHPWEDTVPHPYRYRVRILDLGGEVGPSFGSVAATAVPPTAGFASGLWTRVPGAAPFGPRTGAALAVFQDRLWLVGGGFTADSLSDIWSSADGISWRKEAMGLPFGKALEVKLAVHQGHLWAMGTRLPTVADPFTPPTAYENFVYRSADGKTWTAVADPAIASGALGFGFAAYKDRLWSIWGRGYEGMSETRILSSRDGAIWTPEDQGPATGGPGLADAGVAVLGDTLWVVGGTNMPYTGTSGRHAWKSGGTSWVRSADTLEVLPRYGFALAAHVGRLWMIGGSAADFTGTPQPRADEVWSSVDGSMWTLVDAHAPFGKISGHAAISFQNRLWVIGGERFVTEPEAHWAPQVGIWYLETP